MRRFLAEAGLRRWFYFSVLAEEMNFTRAADRLHIAQPSLSQQIRALERDLGVPLLERSGPRFRLTAAGEAARGGEVSGLLEQYERAVGRITDAGHGLSGELRIAYSHSAAAAQGAGLVAAYRDRYPDVRVSAESGWAARNLDSLRRGTLDLAFVRPPVDEPGIAVHAVDAEELLIAVPRQHPLSRARRLRREQIADQRIVLWPREHAAGYYDSVVRQLWPSGPPHVVREEANDQQLLLAVAAGDGIGPIPEHQAHELRSPGVVFRHVSSPRPIVQLGLAYRTEDTSPLVLNFLALLPE